MTSPIGDVGSERVKFKPQKVGFLSFNFIFLVARPFTQHYNFQLVTSTLLVMVFVRVLWKFLFGCCWWLKFRWVPIFVVFVGLIHEFQYPWSCNFLYKSWKKILWPQILNPRNMSFLFNTQKLVPRKIKQSTVLDHRCFILWTLYSTYIWYRIFCGLLSLISIKVSHRTTFSDIIIPHPLVDLPRRQVEEFSRPVLLIVSPRSFISIFICWNR